MEQPAKPFPDSELWFVTGSQQMYGAQALEQVDRQQREVAAALSASEQIPATVICKGVATDEHAIRTVCLQANQEARCIGVIVWMHTFSPAQMWVAGLLELHKPLLHLHTQYNRELPWDEIDMDFMNLNQSAHGDREFAFLATRMRLPRKTIVGHWRDPAVQQRIGSWARAARGVRELRGLKVARFGDNMRSVAVTEGDKLEARIKLGITVDGYGIGDLSDQMREVGAGAVKELAAAYEDDYEVAPELAAGGGRHQALLDAARIELGLRGFLDAHGYRAFTDTFQDLHGLTQLPGLAVQRLMADGYGFGAEGDWKTAALVRMVKVMTAGLEGGSSFIEDYTYDLSPGAEQVVGSHMLEVCPTIAAARPRCEIHPLAIGDRDDPVRLVFDARPGEALLLSMLDLGDRFRMIAHEVDVVAGARPLPKLPVARALWKPRPDFRTATEAWLTAGGPHHSVLSSSLTVEMVGALAKMLELELVTIDAHTESARFERELQWSDDHYALRGSR